GIVCCWTGTGVSIAANKVPGVRAALCVDAETATGARRWNDANVLALSLRLTTPALAEEIAAAFLAGTPDDEERPNFSRLGRRGWGHWRPLCGSWCPERRDATVGGTGA